MQQKKKTERSTLLADESFANTKSQSNADADADAGEKGGRGSNGVGGPRV